MISHAHKFIFVHIGKNAGTTVENTLRPYCFCSIFEHVQHEHILDSIRKQKSENYFKFAFVRNPWARMASKFFYNKSRTDVRTNVFNNATFRDFIINDDGRFSIDHPNHSTLLRKMHQVKGPLECQLDWISDKQGNVLTDFIGRVENIQNDFDYVCDQIKIPHQNLSITNKTHHQSYWKYYDDEMIEIVKSANQNVIDRFEYKFGE